MQWFENLTTHDDFLIHTAITINFPLLIHLMIDGISVRVLLSFGFLLLWFR